MGSNQPSSLKKEKKEPKKSNLFLNLASILGLFFFLSSLVFLLNTYFKIQRLTCLQNNQPCNQETIAKLNHLLGKSLFFTDLDKTFAQFENSEIKKKLSGELIISLSKNELNFYQINENGLITQTNEEKIDPTINQTINLLITRLQKSDLKFEQMSLIQNPSQTNEAFFIIKLNENLRALVDFATWEDGVYKLEQILKNLQLKEIDIDIKEIDTRFKMPVLKTKYSEI